MSLKDQFLAFFVAAVWGTNFVLIEIGLEDFPPFLFAFLRFALVAFPLAFLFKRPDVRWSALAAYGVLIGFGQFGLMFWAIRDNITPGLASLVVQVQVFFTVLISAILLNERVRLLQWGALAISFCGLVVIAAHTDAQTTLIGLAVVLMAAMSWACGNVIVKTAKPDDTMAFIVWSSIFALPPLLAMSLVLEGPAQAGAALAGASLQGWAVVIWQALGNSLIGYGLWNLLLGRYSAAEVTPWALMVPVFGFAASALFLGEPLPLWKWLAAILIISGLVINLVSARKPVAVQGN